MGFLLEFILFLGHLADVTKLEFYGQKGRILFCKINWLMNLNKPHLLLAFLFSTLFNITTGYTQDDVFYNQSPSGIVTKNASGEKNEVYYVLIESSSRGELQKIRNFCDRNRKIAGYCYMLEPWDKRNVIVVKDFLNRKNAVDFILLFKKVNSLRKQKSLIVTKSDYEENAICK